MSKFKIIRNREPLSSQEITKQMNFKNFISGHAAASSTFFSLKTSLIMGVGGVAVAVAAFLAITNSNDRKKQSNETTRTFVSPPIPQLDVKSEDLMISGNSDTTINYLSGTKVFIPANAFNDKDGKPVDGPYKISFREFHDQIDQLLSGIPMSYDSAGTKYQFESAGMFDINGSKDGEPIFIKEGKELAVEMPSTNLNNNFNVYYLDTIAKNWSYDKDNSQNNIALAAGIDTMVHKRYHTGVRNMFVPKESNPLLDNILIDFDKEEFPELAIFTGIKFEFVDRSAKGNKGANKTWEDAEVVRQEHGRYLVNFTKGDEKQSFVTVPVLDKKDLEKTFAEYDKIRIQRISKLKTISDSLNNLRRLFEIEQKAHKNANEGINAFIQKGKFMDALNEYCDDKTMGLITRQGTMSRMVLVRKFGIYNFDCIESAWGNTFVNTQGKKTINATYYFENDKTKLSIDAAFIIKRDFNGTFAISPKEIRKFPVNIASEADILVIITDKKELLFIKDEEFKAMDYSKADVSFALHKAPAGINTPGELRNYFNM